MNDVTGLETGTGQLELVPASHKDMVEHWPFVLQGLRTVRADLEGHSFWEPEHIREALTQSFRAANRGEPPPTELWLTKIGSGAVKGFAITQHTIDPFIHAPLVLFVWIAYRDPAYRGDLVGETCRQLEEVARVRGYRWLEAMTAIPEFAAHLERHGWSRTLTVMRKDVSPPPQWANATVQ